MNGQLSEGICTLYATVSWTMTATEPLIRESKQGHLGSTSDGSSSINMDDYRSGADLDSWQPRWQYTTGPFKNGAVGLYNMGLTCCLNSLLQTLYMNREFTDLLQSMSLPEDAAALEYNVPHQLLMLFEAMQCSRKNAVHPYRLIRCLQKHGIKLFVQQDAAELFMTIWNLIRDQIAKPQPQLAGRLASLYTIHVQEYLTCLRCSVERTRDSSLIALPLPVSNPRFKRPTSLEEALTCFFQPEKLMEENECLCQNCGKKTMSMQGMRLKTLPRTLTLHLKRLSTVKTSGVQKISRRISFPLSLNLSQLLQPDFVCCDPAEQESWKYELFAVVAHSGTPTFGHYCSYIRSFKDQRWYSFNDSSVSKVSWDDVKCTFGNSTFHWGETAYLLVYRRTDSQ
ncbi:ubl carboxyl-terminal hydrolase 18 [Ambystoma mexicanum]|uniref:ubl carboxyl-terminal hydrolase 18 n=1 Tax=Ambystoma mexicanum TaxID=8296 RepID=UPI0037E762A6